MRVLIVEDDGRVADFLKKGFREESYAVDLCTEGNEAVDYAEANSYDLIVLDVMLPQKNGFMVCREVRQKNILSPIIMLTARDSVEDKVRGLQAGADDYLTKPFAFSELLARVLALLRRSRDYKKTILKIDDLELDPVTRKATRGGKLISLTGKEYALLEYLMRNQGRVITQSMIIEHVWDMNFDLASNVVNVYINHIREKIDRGFARPLIHTIRGVGYTLGNDEET